MRGIPLICCVGALIMMVITPGKTRALTEEEERQRTMKRDIELGLLAIEPPVKEDTAVAIDSVIFNQVEEDRDHLHHSHRKSQKIFPRQLLKMPARNVLNVPEEDLDHLHHGRRNQ